MSPVLLIAEREFRTYVATLSFWLSLAIAPLAAGGAFLFFGVHQSPTLVAVEGNDPAIVRSARFALEEAGNLEGKSFVLGPGGANLVLSQRTTQALDVSFGADFPLSPVGRAMVRHVIERDAARRSAGQAPFVVNEKSIGPLARSDTRPVSRLIAMTMLWLTLTGSLGMLLQAVVRERANRALESLLASARAWQIVTGKMLGVGAVSLLVLVAWGGTTVLLSWLAGQDGPLAVITASFQDFAALMRDTVIYLCAFAFYGATTVMLGALARDSAAAQNAARPMFLLLLVAFFVALASAGKLGAWTWLIYVPPLTPFLMLVTTSTGVTLISQVVLLGTMLLAAGGMSVMAVRLLSIVPGAHNIFERIR